MRALPRGRELAALRGGDRDDVYLFIWREGGRERKREVEVERERESELTPHHTYIIQLAETLHTHY